MESESKNQYDLLQQLKMLRAEKELLEKHVFVLNECLSIEELKTKIDDLEKKKEKLVSLENLVDRLRAEIEPLKYLKSILGKKVEIENKTCGVGLKSIGSKSDNANLDLNFFNTSSNPKFEQSDNIQTNSNNSSKTNSFSSQKFRRDIMEAILAPLKSDSVSTVNDGSIDECLQFLDQYDVVTDQEMLSFSKEALLWREDSSSEKQEPTKCNADNTDDKLQDKQAATTSTYFDAETLNMQLKNKENILSPNEKTELSVNANQVILDTANPDNEKSQHCEASTSKAFKTQENLISDSNASIGDLLLKIPQLLLQQGIDSLNVEGKSNETAIGKSLKKYFSDNPDNQSDLNTSNKKSTDIDEHVESSECVKEFPNTKYSEVPMNSFNEMSLKIDILRGIYSLGYVNPTNLQKRVIVDCVNGRDVIVFAGPGSGRTLMFTVPLLERIKTNLNECQAIVLVPTQDIAIHIKKIIMSVGDFMGVNVCIGGDNVPKKLSVVPHVVVGTPAGVMSMIACKSLRTSCVHTVVLNKVEKMLSPIFAKLVEQIMRKLGPNKQVTLLTSDKLDHVLDKYMDTLRDPLVIIDDGEKEKESDVLKNLPKQFYFNIQEEWKLNALCEINETFKIKKAIVFCNTLNRAQSLCKSLQRMEYAVSLFNLDTSASERVHQLDMFSSDNVRMLITTDPIKGNQFQQATWIINYDLPLNPICYLDRVGKCAENVKVLNLINENENSIKSTIEIHNKSYMIQMPLNMIDLLQY